MKTIQNLNEKQDQFIRDNAKRLFEVTMLDPNDDPENILQSTCDCCAERRKFLQELLALE